MASSNKGEETQGEGRNADDVKLINSLKNKMKILKKAYTDEHEKMVLYQKQVEDLQPKTKRLQEALDEKEALIAKLNQENVDIQEKYSSNLPKDLANQSKPEKGKYVTDLEKANEDLQKANAELKEALKGSMEKITASEKSLSDLNSEHTTKMALITKKLDSTNEQVDALEKERNDLKENCEKYENQIKILFEQKA